MRRAMALATPKTDAGPATSSSPQPSKANKAILRVFVIGKKKHIIVISARAKFGYSRRSFSASKTLEPSDGFDRCGVRQCCSTALGAVHEGNVPDQQRGERLCLMYWSRHGVVGSERSEPHSSPPSRRRRWKRCAFHLIHWCCDWSNILWSALLSRTRRTRRRNSTPTS